MEVSQQSCRETIFKGYKTSDTESRSEHRLSAVYVNFASNTLVAYILGHAAAAAAAPLHAAATAPFHGYTIDLLGHFARPAAAATV